MKSCNQLVSIYLCRSRRKRYTYYVIGQLVQIAMTLYDVTVDVTVVEERQDDVGCHVIFRLDFVNTEAVSAAAERRCSQASIIRPRLPAVSSHSFFTVNKYACLSKYDNCKINRQGSGSTPPLHKVDDRLKMNQCCWGESAKFCVSCQKF